MFDRLRKMKVDALIRLIPSERLEQLAESTQVDHYSKKLQGEIVFRLLLYCLITRKENSLRTLRSAYESITFKALQNKKGISHSSISERLSTIEVSYFEGFFKDCVSAYKNLDGINQDNLLKFDSTIVSLSAKMYTAMQTLSPGMSRNAAASIVFSGLGKNVLNSAAFANIITQLGMNTDISSTDNWSFYAAQYATGNLGQICNW